MLKIAIIGAGASGLAILRHLSTRQDLFDFVCFEQLSNVGGLWIYSDNIEEDSKHPVGSKYSAIYKNMRTNLAKQTMAFPDFDFPEELPSFIGHSDVLKYFQDYTKHFHLDAFIQFNSKVVEIIPKDKLNRNTSWIVKTKNILTCQESVNVFDSVIICNGHFSEPILPEIKGLMSFKRSFIHSQSYKDPSLFSHKNVLIIGAGPSGVDIAADLIHHVNKLWISHNNSKDIIIPVENIIKVPIISEIKQDKVVLNDGQILNDVDAIIACTGYAYSYPFLSPDCKVKVVNKLKVSKLYKQLINIEYPSMFFIGLLVRVVTFPLFDCQARYVIKVLEGLVQLPSKTDMELDCLKEIKVLTNKSLNPDHRHCVYDLSWPYIENLAELAKFEPITSRYKPLYDMTGEIRKENFLEYKNKNYRLNEAGVYEKF